MMQGTMSAPVAPPSPKLELSFRNLLLLTAPALAIALRWGYRMPTAQVMAMVAPIIIFSFSLTPLLRWRARRFERELLRRIQLRQAAGLRSLYARQILLRLFASGPYLAARRAMISQELGEHAAAREDFRLALGQSDQATQLPLIVGLANAHHALGEYADAEPLYRDALRRGGRYPAVYHHLAEGLLQRRFKLDEGIEIVEEGIRATGTSDALETLLGELKAARAEKKEKKGKKKSS